MKKMKYILLVLILFVIVLVNLKNINRFYIKCDIEKDLLNLFKNTDYDTKYFADSVDMLIYWTTETKHRYDVTDGIEDYLYKIDRCYRIKKFNEDTEEVYSNQKAYYKIFNFEKKKHDLKKYNYLLINYLNPGNHYRFVMNNITKEQIDNYDQIKLREELIKDLKTKFIYEDNRWVIESAERIKINLPYNVTVGLTPNGKITNNDVKEYKKVQIKCPLNSIFSEGKEDNEKLPFELTYIDVNNKKKIKELNIDVVRQKDEINRKYKYYYKLDANSLAYLFSIPSAAIGYFTFGQKDFDEDLKARQVIDPDPSTIQVDEQSMEIEMFKKYNQYAEIIVFEYKDGSKKSIFRKCSVTKKPDIIIRDYMKRELPYKNKSLKEVMELYINDKDQYSIDEELLKTGKALVKYESYRRP